MFVSSRTKLKNQKFLKPGFPVSLAAGLKVVDLWEDKVHHMMIIDRKEVDRSEKETDLENRINKRIGLENDNEDLRENLKFWVWRF